MMKLPTNPWLTIGLAIALLFSGGWIGHKWEANKCIAAQATSSVVSTEDNAELAALKLANARYEEMVAKANKDIEANKALATQYIAEADASADRARTLERQLLLKEKEWKRQFAEAMADPKCAELMASEVCPLAPLP